MRPFYFLLGVLVSLLGREAIPRQGLRVVYCWRIVLRVDAQGGKPPREFELVVFVSLLSRFASRRHRLRPAKRSVLSFGIHIPKKQVGGCDFLLGGFHTEGCEFPLGGFHTEGCEFLLGGFHTEGCELNV